MGICLDLQILIIKSKLRVRVIVKDKMRKGTKLNKGYPFA